MHALMLMLLHSCPMRALPLLGVQYLTLTLELWKGVVRDLGMRQKFVLFSFFILNSGFSSVPPIEYFRKGIFQLTYKLL